MAGTDRQAANRLTLQSALRDRPEAFELFEALRRLECAWPERPRLGRSTRPAEDAVRLGQTPSLAFAPRDIERFQPGSEGGNVRLDSLVLGLFGPHGPLPLHLTEYALEREYHARDTTLRAFANLFHHRMIGLFYRAWADAQPTVHMDRPDEDRFQLYVGSLVGLATPGLQQRDRLPDRFKRFFAGRLVNQARNAEGLRAMLQHFLAVPVRVLEFVAEWMVLPEDSHLHLGGGRSVACLGRTTVLGARVWGAQQRFRLRIGPLDREQFNRFLPGGEALQQLVAAVKTWTGDEKAWDVQLVLKRTEVPSTRLGRSGRLGLTTWSGTRQTDSDAGEVILRPAEVAM